MKHIRRTRRTAPLTPAPLVLPVSQYALGDLVRYKGRNHTVSGIAAPGQPYELLVLGSYPRHVHAPASEVSRASYSRVLRRR